jgi:hypothetical protein
VVPALERDLLPEALLDVALAHKEDEAIAVAIPITRTKASLGYTTLLVSELHI